jgi:rhodanese-related sulfurtransferase
MTAAPPSESCLRTARIEGRTPQENLAAAGGMDMRLISAQALKEKLDRGDPLKLVNALGEWEYRAAHIPGSLHFATPEETLRGLARDDEIVVHCSNPSCMASVALYQLLERNGYRNLRRFAGGRRSGRRQAIPWKGPWWNLTATDPGPEQPRRRHAGQDHHPQQSRQTQQPRHHRAEFLQADRT